MTADELPRLVTPEEIAERLGITPRTAREWMRDGTLPGVVRVGRRGMLRMREVDFVAYMDALPGVHKP